MHKLYINKIIDTRNIIKKVRTNMLYYATVHKYCVKKQSGRNYKSNTEKIIRVKM